MNSTLTVKRAYEPADAQDGARILVDGLWPRGESKVREKLTEWDKKIAPDKALRTGFHHGEISFETFRKEYMKQLQAMPEAKEFADHVRRLLEQGNVTLIYASRNEQENNAVVLRDFLKESLGLKKTSPQTEPPGQE